MRMYRDLFVISTKLAMCCLVSFAVVTSSCSGQEAGNIREGQADSMPTLDPVVPESARVFRPITRDSMPVANPESLQEN